jgi:SAM-dependent methyltransferase
MKKEEIAPSTLPSFWDNCYLENQTGWDLSAVSPPLKKYIDRLTNKDISVLIPGCGNAYEAGYLSNNGFNNVTIIDFSSVVTKRLREKFKGLAVRIVNENFFEHEGKYDLILEQTFFCALHPSLRQDYVQKSFELLNEKGKIAGVFFNKKYIAEEPPYIANDEEYHRLFKPHFDFIKYEDCKDSIPPRLGREVFFEFQKKDDAIPAS